MPRPDFSAPMLKMFLRARASDLAQTANLSEGESRTQLMKSAVRDARVSTREFDAAWQGRLREGMPRVRLWGWMGVVPASHGFALHDDGSQEWMGRE